MSRSKPLQCPLSFPGEVIVPDWEKKRNAILKSERLGALIACCEMAVEYYYQSDDEKSSISLSAVHEQLERCMFEYEFQN